MSCSEKGDEVVRCSCSSLMVICFTSGNLQKQTIKIKADWTKAKSSNNDVVSVVETEILAMGRFGFATPESMDAWNSSNNEDYLHSISRLVVIRMKKTGEMHSFIMSVVGDKLYFESKKFKLQDNSYLKREKDLTGFVLFHDLTGKFVNGWIYCEGQITNSIVQPENLDLPIELKSAKLMQAIYDWVRVCPNYQITFTATDGTTIVVAQSCYDILAVVGYYETGGGGGGGGTSGGGGTPGAYIPPTPQPCICSNICSVCGKCLDYSTLKSATLPDGTTTTTTTTITTTDPCEYCAGHPVPVPIVDASGLQRNLKADCIYQKLINAGILSNFISRYFGVTAANQSYLGELNLTWDLGELSGNALAGTFPIGDTNNGKYNSVEITMDESELNSSSATKVALAMLHEALHAKLIAEYYDIAGTTDFKSLYTKYINMRNMDYVQEETMLDIYSEQMGNALFSFDQSQGISHTLDFYKEAVRYSLATQTGSSNYSDIGRTNYSVLANSLINCN